ncbi:MAG: S8 family serine peptidase, partial [Actinomycetota bacterium]
MKQIRRRVIGAAGAAVVALASMGLGSAGTQVHPKAVVDTALSAQLARTHGSAVTAIVSGWSKNALKALDRMHVRHRHLSALPMAFARLTSAQVSRLAKVEGIRSVWADHQKQLFLNESAKMIGARWVTDRMKIDGTGSTIAVIDTGVDATHPDLPMGTKVLHNYEVVAPGISDPNEPLLIDNQNYNDSDDNEHGTHVSGTIAGTGELAKTDPMYAGKDLRGVAPGAKLIVYSANQSETLLSTHTLAAFDHIIAHVRETHVRAISNSWGGGTSADFNPNDAQSIANEAAWRAGIVPVFAAGNSGTAGDTTDDGLNTLSGECISPFVVCVAAETKHSQVATFSSRGRPDGNWDRALAQRFGVGLYRPTVTAPGVDITAPAALSAAADSDKPHGYLTISGTSMATPHVSGVIALIAAANPKLTPAQITKILERTADKMPGWSAYEDGAGAVNARAAVDAALAMKRGSTPRLHTPQLSPASPAAAGKTLATMSGTALPASFAHGIGVETKEFRVPAGVEKLDVEVSWDSAAEN